MMFFHEWKQEIWLDTPKGIALAKGLICNGVEASMKWLCFVQDTGEIWEFDNTEVRAQKNITLGRRISELPKVTIVNPRGRKWLKDQRRSDRLRGLIQTMP